MMDLKYHSLKKEETYILLVLSLNIQDIKYLSYAELMLFSTPCLKSWRSSSSPEDDSSPFHTQTRYKKKKPGVGCLTYVKKCEMYALNSHTINQVLAF